MYRRGSAPPPLFSINVLSWWGEHTPETVTRGEEGKETSSVSGPVGLSVCQGMEGIAGPGPGPKKGSAWDSSSAPAKPEAAGCPSRARSATSGSQHPASAPPEIARPASPLPWARGPRPGSQPPPATYRGSGPHSGTPGLRRPPPPPRSMGSGSTSAPHPEEEEKGRSERGLPHPDSSLSPQLPWTATMAGNAAPSHLPVQPGNTLSMLNNSPGPHPRKLNSSREPAWEEGQC